MTAKTLYDKLWESHVVHEDADGTALIYIDRHLVHEVTSPQAYEGLKLAGRKVWRIDSVVATADHNTPTRDWDKGIAGIRDEVSRQHQAQTSRSSGNDDDPTFETDGVPVTKRLSRREHCGGTGRGECQRQPPLPRHALSSSSRRSVTASLGA